jgi:hypothetical protein
LGLKAMVDKYGLQKIKDSLARSLQKD